MFDELGTKFKCRGSCDNFNERENKAMYIFVFNFSIVSNSV